jgi:hypothetical protein
MDMAGISWLSCGCCLLGDWTYKEAKTKLPGWWFGTFFGTLIVENGHL